MPLPAITDDSDHIVSYSSEMNNVFEQYFAKNFNQNPRPTVDSLINRPADVI